MADPKTNSYWADPTVAPKRQFKWYLQFGSLSAGLPSWIVKTASKPSFTIGETAHKYINHTFYYPGRIEWQTIDVTLVDPVQPDASMELFNAIQAMGYVFPTETSTAGVAASAGVTFSKAAATSTLGEVILRQIGGGTLETGGTGIVPVDKWTLKNAWIKDVKFGDLSYENEDLTELTLTLRYDWAEYAGALQAD